MDKEETFKQHNLEPVAPGLSDYIKVQDGRLVLQAPLETQNFLSGKRGVRIQQEGLDSSGGTIQGATITGGSTSSTLIAGITGILYGNGSSPVTSITPLAGTKVYYVSDSSGGAVNRKLTFQDGILISET